MLTWSKKIMLVLLFLIVLSAFTLPIKGYLVPIEWVNEIEDFAYQVDVETTAEIVVVVLRSLKGHGVVDTEGNEINDIISLGVYIFNEYPLETYEGTQTGIGKEGKDNGVLLLIADQEKQWRIEIGYGLEGDITDIETNRIAQDYLVPQLNQADYGEALYNTVVALAQQIPIANETNRITRGTYYYEDSDSAPSDEGELPTWAIIALILLGVGVGVPVATRGRRRARGGRSGGGGSTGRW